MPFDCPIYLFNAFYLFIYGIIVVIDLLKVIRHFKGKSKQEAGYLPDTVRYGVENPGKAFRFSRQTVCGADFSA